MNLIRETWALFGWLARIGGVFLHLRPLTTLTVIVSSTLSRIATILAFVLPLKVILLVASDGVSRWFAPLVGPGGKDTLVIVLTAAAVISFFASIALDALSDRLAASTSRTVLQGSNELAVVGDQAGQARSIYAQFTDSVSAALFSGAGFVVIAVINPLLFGIVLGAFAAQFLFTAVILGRADRTDPGFLARFVLDDLGDYLNIFSALNFLLAFGVLLYPFVLGAGGNVLGALVCVIVLRRGLSAVVELIRNCVGMIGRKAMIDALVFRDRQYQRSERREARTLREVFHKEGRQARTAEALHSAGIDLDDLDVRWQDSQLQGVNLLSVHGASRDGERVHYQQQIFRPKQDYRLRNEDVLFAHVSRERMRAPGLLLRFSEGPFECQLCEMGAGEIVDEGVWRATQWNLRKELMAVAPPRALVDAFAISRPLLIDRMTDVLIERLEIAVDTAEERRIFESLKKSMPEIRGIVGKLPLYIDNPELRRPNVVKDWNERPLVMSWGQWSLEPLGATLPPGLDEDVLRGLIDELHSKRTDIPDTLTVDHLQLAGTLMKLEKQIGSNALKEGLAVAESLVASSVLSRESAAKIVSVAHDRNTA